MSDIEALLNALDSSHAIRNITLSAPYSPLHDCISFAVTFTGARQYILFVQWGNMQRRPWQNAISTVISIDTTQCCLNSNLKGSMFLIFSSDLCLYIRLIARPRISAKEVKIMKIILIPCDIAEYICMKSLVVAIGAIITNRCIRDMPAKRPRKRQNNLWIRLIQRRWTCLSSLSQSSRFD
ncbi:hypothetical protein FGO68_gene14341 [Halteria grandinella]|uniref:Uncharacterized protein n=1 Tax=Halteria grandinella TaxID=5974 RepID=A0A8J8NCK0_HALGN|nr:hypothetical protein FGO68_gene14341 [Halteria grandinella]